MRRRLERFSRVSEMTEAHGDLADRLNQARQRLVEEHLEASRLDDREVETSIARMLRELKASLRRDSVSPEDEGARTEQDTRPTR